MISTYARRPCEPTNKGMNSPRRGYCTTVNVVWGTLKHLSSNYSHSAEMHPFEMGLLIGFRICIRFATGISVLISYPLQPGWGFNSSIHFSDSGDGTSALLQRERLDRPEVLGHSRWWTEGSCGESCSLAICITVVDVALMWSLISVNFKSLLPITPPEGFRACWYI